MVNIIFSLFQNVSAMARCPPETVPYPPETVPASRNNHYPPYNHKRTTKRTIRSSLESASTGATVGAGDKTPSWHSNPCCAATKQLYPLYPKCQPALSSVILPTTMPWREWTRSIGVRSGILVFKPLQVSINDFKIHII